MPSNRENWYLASLPGQLPPRQVQQGSAPPWPEEMVPFNSTTSGANEASTCCFRAGGPVHRGGTQAPEHLTSHLGTCPIWGAPASCGHEDLQKRGGCRHPSGHSSERASWLRMDCPPGTAFWAPLLSGRMVTPGGLRGCIVSLGINSAASHSNLLLTHLCMYVHTHV